MTLDYSAFDMDNYDIGMLCYVSNCGLDFTDVHFVIVIKAIIECMLDIWNSLKASNDIHEIIDVYHEHEVIELFQREIVLNDDNAEKAIDLLFNDKDYSKFIREAVELYQDIFGLFLCVYFDGYKDDGKRTAVERNLKYLGTKVDAIQKEWVRTELYKSLILVLTRSNYWDVRKAQTEYSYKDKMFLNDQFKTYGKMCIKKVIQTVYMLNMVNCCRRCWCL